MEDNNMNQNADPAANEGTGERTFTQAEVDEIVRKRLARVKRESETDGNNGMDSAGMANREKELEQRELNLLAREKLFENRLPSSLAGVLKFSDEKTLDAAINEIKQLNKPAGAWGMRQSSNRMENDSALRQAMGLKKG